MANKGSRALARPAKKEARATGKKARRKGDVQDRPAYQPPALEPDVTPHKPRPIKLDFRTTAQRTYHDLIRENIVTFGLGPAGTGKTFVATTMASQDLDAKRIGQIIITRPAVTAEEEIGFLPGTEDEKCAPYFQPVKDILEQWLGESRLEYLLKRKQIRFAPMGFLRGCTFDDAFIILDEAQNTTPKQMQLFLSRIGQNCKVVVNGDIDQQDIPGRSGLADAVERLTGVDGIGTHEFTAEDIVRSGIVKAILMRYARTQAVTEALARAAAAAVEPA